MCLISLADGDYLRERERRQWTKRCLKQDSWLLDTEEGGRSTLKKHYWEDDGECNGGENKAERADERHRETENGGSQLPNPLLPPSPPFPPNPQHTIYLIDLHPPDLNQPIKSKPSSSHPSQRLDQARPLAHSSDHHPPNRIDHLLTQPPTRSPRPPPTYTPSRFSPLLSFCQHPHPPTLGSNRHRSPCHSIYEK